MKIATLVLALIATLVSPASAGAAPEEPKPGSPAYLARDAAYQRLAFGRQIAQGGQFRNLDYTKLLLTGAIPEHTEPVAWTHENHGGRVFYTSLGGPEDFKQKPFQTMLVNSIFWTAQRNLTT